MVLAGLRSAAVTCIEELDKLLAAATTGRKTGATNCNTHSSRSHFLFRLRLIGHNAETAVRCAGELNLVDLAGSERVKDSGVVGDALKEAQSINKSLSALVSGWWCGVREGSITQRSVAGQGRDGECTCRLSWLRARLTMPRRDPHLPPRDGVPRTCMLGVGVVAGCTRAPARLRRHVLVSVQVAGPPRPIPLVCRATSYAPCRPRQSTSHSATRS